MTPWQVLHAGRAASAARGHHVHHGAAGSVQYSSGSAAGSAAGSTAADGCRSFCLSREKAALQQLNERLASYLQQVHSLEAANQMLETEIQLELDRKCPRELRHLDTHLRTVSLLQTQINEGLAVQAQLKLQLLNAELCHVELGLRYENERKRRRSLEEKLSKLQLLEEDLQIGVLPELQDWLNRLAEQTTELQIRHQQDMKALLAQMSGGVTVNIEPVEPSDLIQQLEDLRWTNEKLLEETPRDGWPNNQVSLMSSPAVTFDPPAGSEVFQLEQLKRTVMMLEAELAQQEAQKGVLEVSAREQDQSLVQEMVVLEQSADVLCADLESVLQATTRQAADHQTLLDVKTQLENEIQDYRKLLDGLDQLGASGYYPAFAAPFVVETLPCTISRNVTVSKIVSLQGASLVMEEVQPLCEGYTTIRQTANITPHLETVTTVQPIRVPDKHPFKSELTSTDTSANSFLKSENRKSSSAEVRSEYPDSQESSVVCVQIIQNLDEGDAIRDSEPNNELTVITTLVADTQAEPEGQTTTEGCLQVHKTESKTHSVITRTTLELNQAPQVITQPMLCDVSDQTAAEQHNETETLAAPQGPQGPTQTEDQDHARVVTVSLEIEEEARKTERNATVTASCISGSDILTSEEARGAVSGELVLTDENYIKNQENKEGDTLTILRLDQSSQSSQISTAERNKVLEDAHYGSSIAAASSIISDSDEALESEVKIKLVPSKPLAKGTCVQAQTQTNKEAVFLDNKTETNAPVERRETVPQAEVKQGGNSLSNMAMVDDSKLTVSQEESETAALMQTNSTQVSTQTEDQDQGQLVPVSLEIQNEVDGNAGIVAVTASCIPGSGTVTSEEPQATVSVEVTLIDENQEENQEEGVVEVQSVDLRVDQSSAIELNKAVEDADKGSSAPTAPSNMLGADDDTDITAKLECMTSKQTTTDTGMQDNNPETVVTETQLKGNPGPQSVTELEAADSNKQAATDEQKEPKPGAQGNGTKASWDKSQHIAQVVSFSLKTTVEMVEKEEEAALPVSGVSGPHLLTSEETQDTVCGDLTLIVEEDGETQEKVGEEKADIERPQLDVGFGISASSSGEQNKVLEGPNTGFNDASDPIQSVEENFKELAQDILVSTTDSRQHSCSTDLTLSSLSTKEAHGSKEAQVFWSQGEPDSSASPEISSSPVETDISINRGFYPVDAQGQVRSLDSFLSPNGPSPCSSPLEAQLCHSPISEEEGDDEELHLTEAKVNIRTVEKYVLLTKEDGQSPSFSGSQGLQEADRDRHVRISVTDYNKKKETSSSTLNATETCGPAPLETGHQLSGRLEGSALQGTGGCSVTADREQTLPLESLHKSTEENKDVQNQEVHSAGQYDQEEVSGTEDEVKGQKSCDTAGFDGVTGTSGDLGSMATSNESKANDGAASGETAVPSSGEVSVDDRGEQKLNSGSLGQTSMSLPKLGSNEKLLEGMVSAVSQEETRSVGSKGSEEWHIYGSNLGFKSSLDDITTLAIEGEEKKSRVVTNPSEVSNEKGRLGGEEWIVYSGSLGRKQSLSRTRSEDSPSAAVLPNTTSTETRSGSVGSDDPMADRGLKSSNSPAGSNSLPGTENRERHPKAMQQTSNPLGGGGRFCHEEWRVYGASPGRIRSWNSSDSLTRADKEEVATVPTNLTSPQRSVGLRRLGSGGSGEWRVYGGSTERISSWASGKSLPTTDKKEDPIVTANLKSQPEPVGIRRLGSCGSGEWRVYGGSTERISSWASGKSLPKADKEEVAIVTANLPTSPTESLGPGSFGRGGSGEWRVYGSSAGRVSSWVSSNSLPNADKEVIPTVSTNLPTSPPGSQGAGRFGSGSSGEWRVYGGSTGRLSCASSLEQVSVRANPNYVISPPSSHTTSSSRLGAGSASRLSSGSSGGRLSSSSAGQRISTTGRYASTGSSERNPVYSPASTRKNSTGSGSKLTSQSGAKISSSSRSGGTNTSGGRVIISSNRPIRSTGSGTGGNKERISVCKMAALSIAAAGRERGQDQQRQRQQRRQQDAGSAAVSSSLLQRWLNTGEQSTPTDDDILRL